MTELARPAYLRLADALRAEILSGERAPGSRMPSIAALQREYGVSEQPVRQALRVLTSEGLVEGRPGSGTYVLERPTPRRMGRGRYGAVGSPYAAEVRQQGAEPSWSFDSERTHATVGLANRLGVAVSDPLMQTRYLFRADDIPVQLSTSWEPMSVVGGTPVVLPENGPLGGVGVVERMAAIGILVTRVVEDVSARPALQTEARALGLPVGCTMLTIERTHWADGLAVETADIVMSADRYRLAYEIDVSPPRK
ncbi:DNA-binding GntR family transcriptional regulator [Streptacidiphilus sp. MAP12-16]|uniref:GntR family transcriptional regulator n=1 Tax=Streptacidiphilus sp. MAP12-16 TaxID=3156300 RepID=UPI003512FF5D